MTTTRYGLHELLTLLARLLAPLTNAVRDELDAIDYPRPVKPTPPPAPAPAAEPQPAEVEPPAPTNAEIPVDSPPDPSVGIPADLLYVRTGTGKGVRYAVAEPTVTGDRYRKRVRSGRVKYELARD